MHKLTREIRFSLSPFASATASKNTYCASPDCGGMGLFFSLWVEITGDVDKKSGFIVNLSDIDEVCGKSMVPVFEAAVNDTLGKGSHFTGEMIVKALKQCAEQASGELKPAKISSIALKINPYRTLKIFTENKDVIYYSEKFEFAATHKLWNAELSDEENFALFGKCANPSGHGHNYIVEITVAAGERSGFKYGNFQRIVNDNLIETLDHTNLNEDVPRFADQNPTVENITAYAWDKLKDKFEGAELEEVKIWENDRAYCSLRKEE